MADTTVEQACANCRFFEPGKPYRCLRFPPHRLESSYGFPLVFKDDWCGEWKPSHDAVHVEKDGNVYAGVVFRRPDEPEWAGRLIGRDSG